MLATDASLLGWNKEPSTPPNNNSKTASCSFLEKLLPVGRGHLSHVCMSRIRKRTRCLLSHSKLPVCVHTCVCVHVFVCMFLHMYVHMCVMWCMCVHGACIYVCVHGECICVWMCACMCMYVCRSEVNLRYHSLETIHLFRSLRQGLLLSPEAHQLA